MLLNSLRLGSLLYCSSTVQSFQICPILNITLIYHYDNIVSLTTLLSDSSPLKLRI